MDETKEPSIWNPKPYRIILNKINRNIKQVGKGAHSGGGVNWGGANGTGSEKYDAWDFVVMADTCDLIMSCTIFTAADLERTWRVVDGDNISTRALVQKVREGRN